MSKQIVYLDEENKTLEDIREKLTFVADCLQKQDFKPLLHIGPHQFDLESREIDAIAPPQEELIFSTYFSSYPDPQRGNFINEDDFAYIKPLYQSVLELGIGCVIFYDNLSPAFVDKYTTDQIKFVKTELGNLSLNDERFLIYYAYLLKHVNQIKNVLMVDVSDVFMFKNPFELIRQHKHTLFLGRSNLDLIKHSYVNYLRVKKFEDDADLGIPSAYFSMRLFNAGTIGGSIHVVLYLLRQMIFFFNKYDTDRNHNMTVLNYCVFLFFQEAKSLEEVSFIRWRQLFLKVASLLQAKLNLNVLPPAYRCKNENYTNGFVYAGFPFTSTFKKFEMDSEAYLIHK